ncbi:hypothetical protein OG372_31790 [Streptomyces sp. NBC_01020]|uniref:hypothetical protein n=1 Tax=Streptomyces sp. NBC_01020 TaxID=2903722 RepID=UPI003867D451|nr:hypothetical protein OG372_31790 [Streptomyces sp. NBC_01020]
MGETTLRCTMEKWISTWLHREARTMTVLGNALANTAAAFSPRWEEPLPRIPTRGWR